MKQDLVILTNIPEDAQKILTSSVKHFHSSTIPLPNIITSSTKNKCERIIGAKILTPFIFPSSFALLIIQLSPSMMRKNNNKDKGYPYLMPLELLKILIGEPLIRTKCRAKVTQDIIQLVTKRGSPIYKSRSLKKVQST